MPLSNSFEDMSYTGRDGLSRQSTLLNYEDKTKISTSPDLSSEQCSAIHQEIKTYRIQRLEEILSMNPALAGEEYESFVIRNYEEKKLTWDEPLIRGRLILKPTEDDTFLYNMHITLMKRAESFGK